MEFRVLGPLQVSQDGRVLPLGGTQQRTVLAILLLHVNRVVSADALIDGLWGERPPESAANTVQGYVSRLRKLLSSGNGEVIVYSSPGYVLEVEPDQVDSHRFERLVREAANTRANDDVAAARALLDEALALWRGPALADVVCDSFVSPELRRLEELRLTALEERIELDLALGRHAQVVAELEALVAEHPLREPLRGELMLALYRSGRQSEALEVHRNGRRLLVEELGIEPGAPLRELERAILAQDLSLKAPPHRTPEAPSAVAASHRRRWLLATAAALAAGGAITAILVGLHDRSSAMTVPPNAIGVINPRTNKVTDAVHAGAGPSAIAIGEGAVWAANRDDKTVARLNPRTHELETTIPVHGTPSGIAAGKGAVWVVHGLSGTLERIDPDYNQVAERIPVLPSTAVQTSTVTGSVAIGPAAVRDVWVAYSNSTVARINTRSGRISASGYAGYTPAGIAVSRRAVWVANFNANTVSRLDPGSLESAAMAPITVGKGPSAIALGGGAVWVADRFSNAVSRIDPLANAATSIEVGERPTGIAFGYGSLWVANGKSETVSRIDPKTSQVVATIKIGNIPAGIAVGAGRVWVTVRSA